MPPTSQILKKKKHCGGPLLLSRLLQLPCAFSHGSQKRSHVCLELFNEQKSCVLTGNFSFKASISEKKQTPPPPKPGPGAPGTGRCVGMRKIRTTSVASVSIFRVAASAAPKRWPTHQNEITQADAISIHPYIHRFIHPYVHPCFLHRGCC